MRCLNLVVELKIDRRCSIWVVKTVPNQKFGNKKKTTLNANDSICVTHDSYV